MELHDRLQEVFRQVFDNEKLILTDDTIASDIEGWDSVADINLMFGIEQALAVRFKGNEMAEMKKIGELKQFLLRKGTRLNLNLRRELQATRGYLVNQFLPLRMQTGMYDEKCKISDGL